MLGINLAINAAKKLWDALNVTVEEQEAKVNELKLSYETLTSEYTDLSQKQDLTDAEKNRLEYLERRLELDKQILEAEQAQLFDEKTGNSFTDRFDNENLNTQYRKETSGPKGLLGVLLGSNVSALKNNDNYEGISDLFQKRTHDIDSIHEQIAAWKELQATVTDNPSLWNTLQVQIEQALERETKYIDQLSGKENQLTINLGKYADHIADMQQALDSGTLTEEQTLVAQEQIDLWTELYNKTQSMIDAIQKLNGTYEDTQWILRQIDEKYGGGYSDNPFISPVLDAARTQEQQNFIDFSHGLSVEDQKLVNTDDFRIALQQVKESLNGAMLSADDYAAALAAVKDAYDSLSSKAEPVWDYSTTLQNLGVIKETLSVLDQSYAKLSAGGPLGFDELTAIHIAFSDVEGIDNYIQRMQEAGQNTGEVTAVIEELIAAYLNYSGVLTHVTDENKNLIVSALEELGILNAEDLVLAQLNQQAEMLAIQKQFGQSIDTSADIENVIAPANAAHASAEVIAQYIFNSVYRHTHISSVLFGISIKLKNEHVSVLETSGEFLTQISF